MDVRFARLAPWGAGLLAALGLGVALVGWQRPVPPVSIVSPQEGERVGVLGLPVLVRFEPGSVAPTTFRALLNGADVTREFVTAENGAAAQLHGLLDGENILRVEVFAPARSLLSLFPAGTYQELTREVRILHRRPLDIDRG